MSQYKTLIIYTISNDQSKKSFEEELEKIRAGTGRDARYLCPSLRGIPDKGTGIQSLPASLCTQASGQPRHGTVR